jgi:hypothetical protein
VEVYLFEGVFEAGTIEVERAVCCSLVGADPRAEVSLMGEH